MNTVLKEKYFIPIMLFLLNYGEAMKHNFLAIVKSPSTLDKLLRELQEEGLISIREQFDGRRIIKVRLSSKGEKIAKVLLKVLDLMTEN